MKRAIPVLPNDQIKIIRERAGKTPGADNCYGLTAGICKKNMRNILQNERQVELTYEDHRYRNVCRWMIASATRSGDIKAKTSITTPPGFTREVVPILNNPQHQISKAYYLFSNHAIRTGQKPEWMQNQGS